MAELSARAPIPHCAFIAGRNGTNTNEGKRPMYYFIDSLATSVIAASIMIIIAYIAMPII